ncbi:MAG TPA: hypothetical protein VJB34_05740 [Bdellovibrionota bacterium]|nr:hypothetical protein [Bdellovibrionota bacterium]
MVVRFKVYKKMRICFSIIVFLFCILGCATRTAHQVILAEVNGDSITEEDLLNSLNTNEKDIYLKFKKDYTDKIIAHVLLEQEAQRQNITVQALLETEVFSKLHDNKKKLGQQKMKILTRELVMKLRKKSEIKYYLLESK